MSAIQLGEVIERLNRFAADDAAWEPLAGALPEVRSRIAWLQEQHRRIPSPLVVLLFGGTGTGKSTLLNALAGAEIADIGEMRPTTETPTVYHPPGVSIEFGSATYVEDHRLEDLILIDTPDTDSIRTEHAERVMSMLTLADVVLFCGTQQKYANEKSVALLRPVMNERKIILVQTHADATPDIRDDWTERMVREGFQIEHRFRISALEALRSKQAGGSPGAASAEFAALEEHIKRKLPPERRSVKEQNLVGAVSNTIDALSRSLEGKRNALVALSARISKTEQEIARKSLLDIQRQVLDEPHVWVVALAEVVSERAFGLIGTLFRILHGLRMLPARITRTLSPAGLLRPLLSTAASGAGDRYLRTLAASFSGEHAEASAHLARAGFAADSFDQWKKGFVAEMSEHLNQYLEPVRGRLISRAKALTRWTLPLFEILWLAPLLLTIGFPLYHYYAALFRNMDVVLPEVNFLSRSLGMLACIIFIELFLYACLVRWTGRALRRRCVRYLRKSLDTSGFGFAKARGEIEKALAKISELDRVRDNVARN